MKGGRGAKHQTELGREDKILALDCQRVGGGGARPQNESEGKNKLSGGVDRGGDGVWWRGQQSSSRSWFGVFMYFT